MDNMIYIHTYIYILDLNLHDFKKMINKKLNKKIASGKSRTETNNLNFFSGVAS